MTYLQFILALLSILIGGIIGVSFYLFKRNNKLLAFKLITVVMASILAITIVETSLFIIPQKQPIENPWYTWSDNSVVAAEGNLPFRRTANIQWEGESHGDLATLNNDKDPYARVIEFKTDKDGFRNDENISNTDIIVLGDSYTEAGNIPINENYVSLLKENLGVSVKNMGTSGYAPPMELIALEKFGVQCNPKTVILQITEANDLIESAKYYDWIKGGRPQINPAHISYSKFQMWQNRSPSYSLYRLIFPDNLNPYLGQGVFTNNYNEDVLTRFYGPPNEDIYPINNPIGWNVFEESLININSICQSRKVKLLVFIIPKKFNVMKEFIAFKLSDEKKIESMTKLNKGQSFSQKLAMLCRSMEVEYFDPTEHFKEYLRNGVMVYQPFDTHLSAEGHQAIAELLSSKLKGNTQFDNK